MPNIRSAKKKMRQDVKRTKKNDVYMSKVKKMMKNISKSKEKVTAATVKKAYSTIDKAAKSKVLHKNKAARLKSKVSRLIKK